MSRYDVATDSVVAQFPIRDGKTKPVRIAFSPDGGSPTSRKGRRERERRRRGAPDSDRFDCGGRAALGIALSPEGRWLYTADGRSNTVSVIDTGIRKVIAAIPVGERPNDLRTSLNPAAPAPATNRRWGRAPSRHAPRPPRAGAEHHHQGGDEHVVETPAAPRLPLHREP